MNVWSSFAALFTVILLIFVGRFADSGPSEQKVKKYRQNWRTARSAKDNYVLHNVTPQDVENQEELQRLFNTWQSKYSISQTEINDKSFYVFSRNLKFVVKQNERFKEGISSFHMDWYRGFCKKTRTSDRPFAKRHDRKLLKTSKREHSPGLEDILKRPRLNSPQLADTSQESGSKAAEGGNEEQNTVPVFTGNPNVSAPVSFDWRLARPKMIPSIESQGNCGCCYAISTVKAEAAHHHLRHQEKEDVVEELSIQQVVDCNRSTQGCDGGDTEDVYDYMKKEGLVRNEAYPYVGKRMNNVCRLPEMHDLKRRYIFGYGLVARNEEALKIALYCLGPISVTLTSRRSRAIEFYSGGIYDWGDHWPNMGQEEDPNVPLSDDDDVDDGKTKEEKENELKFVHTALLVGYGEDYDDLDEDRSEHTDDDKDNELQTMVPYWIILMSWGDDYGGEEKGYIKVQRGDNFLSIKELCDFPIVTGKGYDYLKECLGARNSYQ